MRSVVRDGRDDSDRRYKAGRQTAAELNLLRELETERALFRAEVELAVARDRQRIVDAIRASDIETTGWTRAVIRDWIIDVVEGK